MRRRAGAITLGSIILSIGVAMPAMAEPLAQRDPPPLPTAPAGPGIAMPVGTLTGIALPLAAEPADEAAAVPSASKITLPRAEPMERAERQRVLSYILLQGLQEAGPLAGAR